jgi:hypothetical protein
MPPRDTDADKTDADKSDTDKGDDKEAARTPAFPRNTS